MGVAGSPHLAEVSLGSPLKGHFPRLSRRGQQGAILKGRSPVWDFLLLREDWPQPRTKSGVQRAILWTS